MKSNNNHDNNDSSPTLDEALINLQKAFSSVSSDSAKVPKEQARAVIYGDVSFSLELNVDSVSGKLSINKDGEIRLSISGTLHTDIRHEVSE